MNRGQLLWSFLPFLPKQTCRSSGKEANEDEAPCTRGRCCKRKPDRSKVRRRFDGVNLVGNSRQGSEEECSHSAALVTASYGVKHALRNKRNFGNYFVNLHWISCGPGIHQCPGANGAENGCKNMPPNSLRCDDGNERKKDIGNDKEKSAFRKAPKKREEDSASPADEDDPARRRG